MKNTLALCGLLLSAQMPAQQQFQKLYSGDYHLFGYGITERSNGGYATCGAWYLLAGHEGYMLLTDEEGALESLTRYSSGSNGRVWLNDIDQTADGGFVMCGFIDTGNFVTYGLVIKTDATGNITWSRIVGGGSNDEFKQVLITSDGGYFAAGATSSFGNGGIDVLAVKLDATGQVEWAKAAGTGSQDGAFGCVQTSDDGYAICGRSYSVITPFQGGSPRSNNDNIYMLRLEENGGRTWGRATGGYGSDFGSDVVQLSNGSFVLSGTHEDYGGYTYTNAIMVGVNGDGTHSWTKLYDFDSSYNQGYDLVYDQTESRLSMIATSDHDSADGASPINPFLFQTSLTGDLHWAQMYGIEPDELYDLHLTSDNGFIMSGYAEGFSGQVYGDAYLIKTDANGLSGCHEYPIDLTVIDTMLDYGTIGDSVIDIPSLNTFNYNIHEQTVTPWDSTLCLFVSAPSLTYDVQLGVYPNPAHEHVLVTGAEEGSTVSFMDLAGEVVAVRPAGLIDVSDFPDGMYLLKVMSGESIVVVRKVVVH
jgi:hypothetical protein